MNVLQRKLCTQAVQFWTVLTLLLWSACAAPDWQNVPGVLDLLPGGRPDHRGLFKDLRISMTGWLQAGVTYNFDQPANRYNGPVTFADRHAELQLNQLYVHFDRPVDTGGTTWDWGGRFDLMFGTDAGFTEARGDIDSHWDINLTDDRFYHLAFPQAYGELFAPLGQGLRVKLGHFYTIVGSESITAPDNFFYTRSYATQYGEPFTHTGLLLNYRLQEQLDVNIGTVTGSPAAGWDGAFDRSQNNFGFIGGFTWASPSGNTSIAVNATHGSVRDPAPGDQNLVSAVLQQDVAPSVHWKTQLDYAWLTMNTPRQNAEWYAVVNYLTVDLNEELASGIRFEWFRDDDGVRVFSPAREGQIIGEASSYYALTAGLTWKPVPWFTLRPNLRYDWSDSTRPFGAASSNQTLLSLDFLIML